MSGMEDNVSTVGDWTQLPNPSPRSLISRFLNGELDSKLFDDLLVDNENREPLPEPEKQKFNMDSNKKERDAGFQFLHALSLEPSLSGAHKPNSQVGLSERIAARAGFTAPKINTACNTSPNLESSTSDICSSYLTIPPGLSPTSLLESPVFLSDVAQTSPTTGKLLIEQYSGANSVSNVAVPDKIRDNSLEVVSESFAFKPHHELSSSYLSSAYNKQSFPRIELPILSEHPVQAGSISDSSDIKDTRDDFTFNKSVSDSFVASEQSPTLDNQQDGEADLKGDLSSSIAGAPAEDGYNWRKYGQKQVKGSEFPRSYYKCTHPNCPVKKKVERSREGQITEIIYKGAHNHLKQPPNRRSGVTTEGSENPGSQAGLDGKQLWTDLQNSDWKNDNLEATSPAPMAAEFVDPSCLLQTQDGPRFEAPDAVVDVSSTLSNDEEDEREIHCSVSLGADGEGDETESKRRKIETSIIDLSAASRAAREPRVVVQTTSEIDILDDGYRWRKYGQKVVKGNPNPRSYYKCTNLGCPVRKHVERASHDLKSVITTYEGKHNHDVPAARSSSNSNSGSSSAAAVPVAQPQSRQRVPELTRDTLMRFNNPAAQVAAFGLSREQQLGTAPGNFVFAAGQQGLNNLGFPGLSITVPMKMPVFPPAHAYFGQSQVTETRFEMPEGEVREEMIPESRLPAIRQLQFTYKR